LVVRENIFGSCHVSLASAVHIPDALILRNKTD
jgi:hypothetical protein